MDDFGFIILRHINAPYTSNYWIRYYKCIRHYYPENEIIIIDDDSNRNYINFNLEQTLYKTKVIYNDTKSHGEILPYYYYLKYKFFKTALVLHDSVFINNFLEFDLKDYLMLWNFEHHWDNDLTTISKLKNLECSSELIEFYMNKEKWYGCFGAMAIITYDYLNKINNLFNILNLMQLIKTREDRMDFERIFGCLLQILGDCNKSQFGNIHCYCPWGIKYKDLEKYNYLPVVKVWTGR